MWQQVELALSQSAHRALVTLANFLPGFLALLLAICILTIVGALLAALLRRVLTLLRFDERLTHSSIIPFEWAPSHSPTLLITRVVFWGSVVLGCLIGISAFDAAYAGNSQMSFFLVPYLTHSVGAIILFIVGTLIARFLARTVLIEAVNARLSYARFLSLGVKWLVLVLTTAMVLDHLEIGGTVVDLAFGILFGGIVLTLSLAIGLGSRDIVSRSLEKNADSDVTPINQAPRSQTTSETLRHF
ncbi:MAG: mechanosensitive ion channel family protein [Acidobacteria bacterium]|nr:mechanosensitive ion channel family protein [Acidobacteriota bacterium]